MDICQKFLEILVSYHKFVIQSRKGENNMGKGGDYEMYCKYRGITEDIPEGRYYLGGDLWSHPETGGDFYFEDERKNHQIVCFIWKGEM